MFWFALVAFIFTTAVQYLLRPRPRFHERSPSRPSSVGEFQSPTAEEGRVIPYLAGTGLIEGPNVLWSGNYLTEPVVEDGYTFGHKYFLGVAYGMCLGPIDRVLDVRFDEKILAPSSSDLPAAQVLVLSVGSVNLPAGTYASSGAASKAITDAIHAQTADDQSRVLYGFEVVAGLNDRVKFTVAGGGPSPQTRDVLLSPGRYDAAGYKQEFERQTRNGFPIPNLPSVTLAYDSLNKLWSITAAPGRTVTFDAVSTFFGTLGFDEGASLLAAGAAEVAPYQTDPDRFFFSLVAATSVLWTDGATNCHAYFGMDGGAPDMTASQMADSARFTDESFLTFTPGTDSTTVVVNAPTLFGGERDEGGIVGTFDVYHGTLTQESDAYLTAQFGNTAPAWRGLSYVVARRPYWGTTPYLKTFSLMAERCPNGLGLGGDRHRIEVDGALGDDANPICHLYEVLTDDRFGLAIPASMIDLVSFRAAGDTVHGEGLGMSVVIDASADGLDLVQDIMRHVDGVLYSDPETAQLTLKLIRADYEISTLPVLDETNVISVKLSRPTWDETKNVVKIQYTDRVEGHTPRVVQIQNLANVQMAGRLEVEEVAFHGLTNRAAAELVGGRVLRVLCFPLGQLEIVATRYAQRLRPGGAFVLNWPPLGISGLVCRTGQPKPGEIRNNLITIDASEDVYALDRAVYSAIA